MDDFSDNLLGIAMLIGIINFVVCLIIAPLIIWRNTNRTNRLLTLMMLSQGLPKDDVLKAYRAKGADLSGVPGSGVGFLAAVRRTSDDLKSAAENFKSAAAQPAPEPPPAPSARYCHHCGADAPIDATACPTCTRILPTTPTFCPRCSHEISHMPAACPGCRTPLRWKEPTP